MLHRFRRLGGDFENPFMTSAIELWEAMLDRGYATTAVSGSDAKQGVGLGSSATAVYADQLSRAALADAIRAGRAYVRTRGVADSPALEMTVSPDAGPPGTFGSRFVVDPGATVPVSIVVRGGDGQRLRLIRNGAEVDVVKIVGDPFEHRFRAGRAPSARVPSAPGGGSRRSTPRDARRSATRSSSADRTTRGEPLPAAPMPPVKRQFLRNMAAAQGLRSTHVM